MAIDLAAMSPQARERYLALGRRYATRRVLLQGDKTSQGLAKHAALLVPNGFALRDGTRLAEACDQVRALVVGRAQAGGSRKLTGEGYQTAARTGRNARRSAITALTASEPELLEQGDEAVAQLVQTVLASTSLLPGSEALPTQLQMLFDVLVHPTVAAAAVDRGGPGIVGRLHSARTDMLTAIRERAGHTPVSAVAEERDILEGIVVSLARSANAAARVTARALGQPSIARDFALTYLEASRRSGDEDPETPAEPGEPADPEAP